MTDNQSQSWRNGLRLLAQNGLALVFLTLAGVTVSSCRQNAHPPEEQVQTELLKSSELTEGMAEGLFFFIQVEHVNDKRKAGQFFEEAVKCSAQADRFYNLADSLLNLSEKEWSADAIHILTSLYQATTDSMLECVVRYSNSQVIADSLAYNMKAHTTNHPKLTATVLRNSIARMEFRVMRLLFQQLDSSEWMPSIRASGRICEDRTARITLMSKGIQDYHPNRFTIMDSVLFMGKQVMSKSTVVESKSFAEVEIENAKSGKYRLIGRVKVVRKDGMTGEIPFDEEVEIGEDGN